MARLLYALGTDVANPNTARRALRRSACTRRVQLEQLEPRQLLAASPVISEFLAKNDSGLLDGDLIASDWIELRNAGDEAIDLAGWHWMAGQSLRVSQILFCCGMKAKHNACLWLCLSDPVRTPPLFGVWGLTKEAGPAAHTAVWVWTVKVPPRIY